MKYSLNLGVRLIIQNFNIFNEPLSYLRKASNRLDNSLENISWKKIFYLIFSEAELNCEKTVTFMGTCISSAHLLTWKNIEKVFFKMGFFTGFSKCTKNVFIVFDTFFGSRVKRLDVTYLKIFMKKDRSRNESTCEKKKTNRDRPLQGILLKYFHLIKNNLKK